MEGNHGRFTLSCLMCGEESADAVEYASIHEEAQVCARCASIVANAFAMKHSGEYLTWPNEDIQDDRPRRRRKISARVRKQVMERDAYRCVKCNGYMNLCIDHKYPHSLGGSDDPSNLQTLCWDCNNRKRDRVEEVAA